MTVSETDLVKKNHQISVILNQKIALMLIEKLSMTAITEHLSVSTSTVIREVKEFQFKTNLDFLPAVMSWEEVSFKKGRMSFVVQDFESGNLLDG